MQPYAFINRLVLTPIRWASIWILAIGAVLVPLQYERLRECAGSKDTNEDIENRAAVALNGWESDGLRILGSGAHRSLELTVPAAGWAALRPVERRLVQRRIACSVINGVPIEGYVVRDESGKVLAQAADGKERS